jgi:general secretion pathway protein M
MTRGSPAARFAALLLFAATILAAYWLVGWRLQAAYQEALTNIGDRRLVLARMDAAKTHDNALAATLRTREEAAGDSVIAAETDSGAAALLQSHLQKLLENSAAQLTSVEALQNETRGSYRTVSLRAQFTTGHEGLRQILFALEAGRPVVFLDNTTISARSVRAFGVERPLDVQVDLTAFRYSDSSKPQR